jgi:hypothetical protein
LHDINDYCLWRPAKRLPRPPNAKDQAPGESSDREPLMRAMPKVADLTFCAPLPFTAWSPLETLPIDEDIIGKFVTHQHARAAFNACQNRVSP